MTPPDPIIRLEDVYTAYEGADRPTLMDVSLSIEKDEFVVIGGPNGAGKTTTIRILLGLLAPGAGEVRVLGRDLASDDDARRRVGVLFENNGLADRMSAAGNLAYYAGLYGVDDPAERIDELLTLVDLADRRDDLVGTFSTGMKRKLGIARAILHRPEVVFLDEPSSGLDPGAQRMVRDLILELSRREEMTVFLNSHHLDEVQRICSTVAILAGGGSGHEPLHGGYVGYGMLDAACPGEVLTSPTPDQMYEAAKAVDGGKGVLFIVKNYTGDVMNFQMASDLLAADGIPVAQVVIDADVAVQDSLYTAGRRGVGGTVLIEKIVGAKAEAGASLEEVKALC